MKNEKLVKVERSVVELPGARSMGVIGDPGCEGLGAANLKVYAGALEQTAGEDFTLIVGDLVPAGEERFYRTIREVTQLLAQNPVYALRGNHDTGEYDSHLGRRNYALLAEGFAVVVLDNALRTFEDEGLELLTQVLEREDVRRVVAAFHIPVPNHFIQNCVSQEEFDRLRAAYAPHREKVKYLLCGHVHSRFVDEVDGIPLVCTGGGGAMIEDVSESIRAGDVEHHVVRFFMDGEELRCAITDLSEGGYRREGDDPILGDRLRQTVEGELMAHFRYLMLADRAGRRGLERVENLFRALAASEYYHARSFYAALDRPAPFREAVTAPAAQEDFEYAHLYPMLARYAKARDLPLAQRAYTGAAAAEKEHGALLRQAARAEDFPLETFYVCPICGYLMTEQSVEDRCPVCGGPRKQFNAFSPAGAG